MNRSDKVTICEAGPADHDAIATLVAAAFGRQDEAELVRRLRADGDAIAEFVAVENADKIAGHILFSSLKVEPATIRIAALAPVSVLPERQKAGFGSALIREGIMRCKALGFDAVAVLGDPAYYSRFGFTGGAAQVLNSVYSGRAYQALELRTGALAGGLWSVSYPRAFD
jgi:putative acetyltransferase